MLKIKIFPHFSFVLNPLADMLILISLINVVCMKLKHNTISQDFVLQINE